MQVSACLPCIGRAPAANNGLRLNRGINQASLLRTRHSPWQSRWTSSSPFSEVLNPPHSFTTTEVTSTETFSVPTQSRREDSYLRLIRCSNGRAMFPICALSNRPARPRSKNSSNEKELLSWASSREVKAGDTSCCERLSLVWTPMDTRDTYGWTPMDIHEHTGQRRGTT